MILNSGLTMAAVLARAGSGARLVYLDIGSGTTAPSFTQSGLQSESYRALLGHSNLGSPLAGTLYSGLVNSVQSYGIGSITEGGLNSSSTLGSQFNRWTHAGLFFDIGSDWMIQNDVVVRQTL